MFADEAEDLIVNEPKNIASEAETKLRDVPTIPEVLGIHKHQIMIINIDSLKGKFFFKDIYDDFALIQRIHEWGKPRPNHQEWGEFSLLYGALEYYMDEKKILLLTKNREPVLARRLFKYFGPYVQ